MKYKLQFTGSGNIRSLCKCAHNMYCLTKRWWVVPCYESNVGRAGGWDKGKFVILGWDEI